MFLIIYHLQVFQSFSLIYFNFHNLLILDHLDLTCQVASLSNLCEISLTLPKLGKETYHAIYEENGIRAWNNSPMHQIRLEFLS